MYGRLEWKIGKTCDIGRDGGTLDDLEPVEKDERRFFANEGGLCEVVRLVGPTLRGGNGLLSADEDCDGEVDDGGEVVAPETSVAISLSPPHLSDRSLSPIQGALDVSSVEFTILFVAVVEWSLIALVVEMNGSFRNRSARDAVMTALTDRRNEDVQANGWV